MSVNLTNENHSSMLCYGMPVKSYIRRRRHCLSCDHRFSTVEISQEDIEATCLELKNLRDQVAKQKSAMQLLLDCNRP
jgi:transcriptional regulator NrdR family protein